VIERKTWDDLSKSIRQGRFVEQKQRLRASGFIGVIVLVEGSVPVDEQRVLQALANTQVHDGFLVHQVSDPGCTARFLCSITQRIASSSPAERLLADVQRQSKKSGELSVRGLWARQLTVCPGMSAQRARIVADKFPSFSALSAFYAACPVELRPGLLSLAVPEITPSVSSQMSALFGR